MRKESHVVAALKYIEENLPVGEDGLYGLVNNAGVRHHVGGVVGDLFIFVGGVVACGLVGDFSPWSTLLG